MHLHALRLQEGVSTGHTISGLQNSLIGLNWLIKRRYIQLFTEEKIRIYDSRNTVITVSRAAVLEGWKVPREGLWIIPLVKNVVHVDEDTILTKKAPTEILRENLPRSTTC